MNRTKTININSKESTIEGLNNRQHRAETEAADAWKNWNDCQTACRKAYYDYCDAQSTPGISLKVIHKASVIYKDADIKRDAAYADAVEADERLWQHTPRY